MKRDERERLHTSVLVSPAAEKRGLRKQRVKAAKQIEVAQLRT